AFSSPEAARGERSYRMLDAFTSNRDLQQLIERCIEAENVRFAIFHALSDNRFKRLDITDARELVGYAPQDDVTAENPHLKDLNLRESVATHNMRSGRLNSGLREDL